MRWVDLKYWESGEYQVVQERLDDLRKVGGIVCPDKRDLFRALDLTALEETRVVFMGQDPYPNHGHSCGLAFSVPSDLRDYPPSLENIFEEYEGDLRLPPPPNGDLTKWCKQGVLLWNAYPSCTAGLSLSHRWYEWSLLTKEIIEVLNPRGIIFVFIGSVPKKDFLKYVDIETSEVLCFDHPSPRATLKGSHPIKGSRMFSTINDMLVSQGLEKIDWRL